LNNHKGAKATTTQGTLNTQHSTFNIQHSTFNDQPGKGKEGFTTDGTDGPDLLRRQYIKSEESWFWPCLARDSRETDGQLN